MQRIVTFLVMTMCWLAAPASADVPPGEIAVDPYVVTDANAGADPYPDDGLYIALGGEEGVARIVERLVDGVTTDPRIEGIFAASDFVRLRRTLREQVCYLAGGPCTYTGRDMTSVHADHGVTTREFNALVEQLQFAMDAEGVPNRAQNRLLAKLAPMHRVIVTR